ANVFGGFSTERHRGLYPRPWHAVPGSRTFIHVRDPSQPKPAHRGLVSEIRDPSHPSSNLTRVTSCADPARQRQTVVSQTRPQPPGADKSTVITFWVAGVSASERPAREPQTVVS